MVSFRISDEEYRSLKALCATHGTRSVSEFARVAINKLLETSDEPIEPAFTDRFAAFNNRLTLLDHEVARLTRILEHMQVQSGD